jgi:hypothetical protein
LARPPPAEHRLLCYNTTEDVDALIDALELYHRLFALILRFAGTSTLRVSHKDRYSGKVDH